MLPGPQTSGLRVDYSLTLNRVDEDVSEAHPGPVNRTALHRKSDRTALDTPAEPLEELLFFTVDDHGTTPDSECGSKRMMGS